MVHVKHDHALLTLLAERIARLTGPEGSARLAVALDHVRQQVEAELAAAEAEAEAEAAEAAETSSETSSVAGSPARWVGFVVYVFERHDSHMPDI